MDVVTEHNFKIKWVVVYDSPCSQTLVARIGAQVILQNIHYNDDGDIVSSNCCSGITHQDINLD